MWTNAVLKALLTVFRFILLPVEMVTTFAIGITFLIPFWTTVYVFIMTIIWFPFSMYIMSTSWLYQKVLILRPILAIISIPLLIVLDSFLGIMANPDKADKYNKALIIDSWPFSSWGNTRNMPFLDEWRGFGFAANWERATRFDKRDKD